jgi:hypothetical protein
MYEVRTKEKGCSEDCLWRYLSGTSTEPSRLVHTHSRLFLFGEPCFFFQATTAGSRSESSGVSKDGAPLQLLTLLFNFSFNWSIALTWHMGRARKKVQAWDKNGMGRTAICLPFIQMVEYIGIIILGCGSSRASKRKPCRLTGSTCNNKLSMRNLT